MRVPQQAIGLQQPQVFRVDQRQQAFHLADQANREEDDSRWTHIQAALAVLERFVTEVQRQVLQPTQPPRELEPQRDGGT